MFDTRKVSMKEESKARDIFNHSNIYKHNSILPTKIEQDPKTNKL